MSLCAIAVFFGDVSGTVKFTEYSNEIKISLNTKQQARLLNRNYNGIEP